MTCANKHNESELPTY